MQLMYVVVWFFIAFSVLMILLISNEHTFRYQQLHLLYGNTFQWACLPLQVSVHEHTVSASTPRLLSFSSQCPQQGQIYEQGRENLV